MRARQRTLFLSLVLSAALAAVLATSGASANAETCDRLLGEPQAGPPTLNATDAAAAKAACAAAVGEDPSNARLKFQYARALEAAGDRDEALRLYTWAADDGFELGKAAAERLAAAETVPTIQDVSEDAHRAADALDGIAASLRRYVDALPGDPRDRIALIAQIGSDPDAIANWVASNIRLIPYRGMLRDADGVLLDRSANTLDRAILLARLLGDAGVKARLARATLTPEQALAVLQATTGEARTAPSAATRDELIAALSSDPRVPADVIQSVVEKRLEEAEAQARARDEMRATVEAAVRRGFEPQRTALDQALQERAIDATRDYWWVQIRSGGAWRDLDPSAAAVGSLTVEQTYAPDSLPDDVRHRVTVRVIVEMSGGGERTETALVSRDFKPAEWTDKTITIQFRALSMRPSMEYALNPDPGAGYAPFREAVLSEWAWMPFILVDETTVLDRFFTDKGETPVGSGQNLAARGLGSGFAAVLGDLDSVLGSVLDDEKPEAAGPVTTATALWIEIEVAVPGEEPKIHRRAVFDLVGPDARKSSAPASVELSPEQKRTRAEAMLSRHALYVFGAQPNDAATSRIMLPLAAEWANRLAEAYRATDAEAAFENIMSAKPLPPLPGIMLALMRDDATPVRPNIFAVHETTRLDPDSLIRTDAFDIIENAVARGGIPSATDAIVQGVADTVGEAFVLEGEPLPVNTARLHSANLERGTDWTLLADAASGQEVLAALPADTRARIEAALEEGSLVLAPAAPGSLAAWWQMDPRTGSLIGFGANGMGTEMAERTVHHVSMLDKAACAFSLVGMGVAVVTGGDKTLSWFTLAGCAFGPGIGRMGKIGHALGHGMAVAGCAVDALDIIGHLGGHGDGGHGGGHE